MVLVLTLVELILALGLLVLLVARQRAQDPSTRERLGSIAARVTLPTIGAIVVLTLIVMLQGV